MTDCFRQECSTLCIDGYIRQVSMTCNLMIPSVIGTLCCTYLDSNITLSFDYTKISTIFKNRPLLGNIHPMQLFMILNSYHNNKNILIQDLCTAISNTDENKLSLSQKIMNELKYDKKQRQLFYDILLHQTDFIHLTDLNPMQILNILQSIMTAINSQFDAVKLRQIVFDHQLNGTKFLALSQESFIKLFSSKLDIIMILIQFIPISRSKWIPDRATKVCMSCEFKFTRAIFKSGKHHCRKCAIVICQSCVNKLNNYIVCTQCYENFKKQNDECWRSVYKSEIEKWRIQYVAVWLYKKGKWTDDWMHRYCVLTRSYPEIATLRCYIESGGKETDCVNFKNVLGCRKLEFEFLPFGFEIVSRTRRYKFGSDSKHDRDMLLNTMALFGINININCSWTRDKRSLQLQRILFLNSREHVINMQAFDIYMAFETGCNGIMPPQEVESDSTSEELSDLD